MYRLQKRIYRAQARGDVKAVHSLQRLLMKSQSGPHAGGAARHAGQPGEEDGRGRRGQVRRPDGPPPPGAAPACATRRSRHARHAGCSSPNRARANNAALGIPDLTGSGTPGARQARPGTAMGGPLRTEQLRVPPGALQAMMRSRRSSTVICKKDKYVLDADIKGCFDHIDHQALLNKLDSTPAIRRAVKAWLTGGRAGGRGLHPDDQWYATRGSNLPVTGEHCPARHGRRAARRIPHGRQRAVRIRPTLVRYADDFVILCRDLEGVKAARAAVEHWLGGTGAAP